MILVGGWKADNVTRHYMNHHSHMVAYTPLTHGVCRTSPPPLLARGGKGFRKSVWREPYLPHSWATCVCGLGHHGSWNAVWPTLVNSIICCQRELPVGKVKARSLLKSHKGGFPIFCNQRKSPSCWSFVADKYDTFDNCLQRKNTFSLGRCSNLPTPMRIPQVLQSSPEPSLTQSGANLAPQSGLS